MGQVKIIGGSFPSQIAQMGGGKLCLRDQNARAIAIPLNRVAEVVPITEANKVNFGGAVKWAAVGGLLAGPLGLLGGSVLGGRGNEVFFAVRLVDGRSFHGKASPKVFSLLHCAVHDSAQALGAAPQLNPECPDIVESSTVFLHSAEYDASKAKFETVLGCVALTVFAAIVIMAIMGALV